jgi:molybdenum cofactor synthesis domain-containing protein
VIPFDEARRFVLSACRPLPPVRAPLSIAHGRVLAADVRTDEAVPPFDNTGMDGFAVQAADTKGASPETPLALDVIGTIAAGAAPTLTVVGGQAARIMTGAPMPPGADAVVMVEHTTVTDDGRRVLVAEAVEPGTHVRIAGDDLAAGALVFERGDVVTAGHLGVLASVGLTGVPIVPQARVGVLSTGDELVAGGGALAPGQIRDSNRISLLALVDELGAEGVDLGLVRDDEVAIERAILSGVEQCDALLTSGGVSMGDYDYVKVVLDRIGEMRWMQVAIRPAKPLAFGTVTVGRRPVPVFGLPGNPVSSMVSFGLFARPGLRQMMGFAPDDLDLPRVDATAIEPLRRHPDGKVHFVRVVCSWDGADHGFRVRSAGGQGSHHLTGMAGANGLAVLDDGPGVEAGGRVPVLLLNSA